MDLKNKYAERKKLSSLSIHEQLRIIEEQSNESNTIIGEICLSSMSLNLTDREQNKRILADLFGNASFVKDYGILGMGDVEYRWIFSIRNLLIGIFGISYYGGPLSIGGNYKVFRLDNEQNNTVDIDKIEPALFGW